MNRHKFVALMLSALLVGCQQTPVIVAQQTSGGEASVAGAALVYTTAKDTDKRLALTDKLTFGPGVQPSESEISVFVNPNKRFQKVLGIGGAFTDASAEVFAKLSETKQEEFLKAYY